ncbi:MAG: tripartite tricarboxylate transporter TctB family protein [Thermodesulfobacteriota bacterium]
MQKPSTKYPIIPFLFWGLLGILAMLLSRKLDLGSFHKPGPGLVPFLLGLVLLVTSLYPIIMSFASKREASLSAKEVRAPANYRKMIFVLFCMLLYSFLFERLGFVISTSCFLVCLFRGMGNRWSSALIGSAITVLATYFLFTLLGIRFPRGFW